MNLITGFFKVETNLLGYFVICLQSKQQYTVASLDAAHCLSIYLSQMSFTFQV